MESAELRDELLCSICLALYIDPATLSCGHNFCQVCIEHVLYTQDGSGVYSCPECAAEFQERPALKRNKTLCNVVENFLTTQPHQEETKIFCSYCVDSPVPAVKSCLMCDKHLRVHSKSAEHFLTEPSTNLENMECSIHKELFKYYCTKDAICICVSCRLDGEHRGHWEETLDEASQKKKKKLRNVLQKLITKREKTEERLHSLEVRRIKTQIYRDRDTERVTALFSDLRRRLDDLKKKVLSEIFRREQQVSLSLSDVIQKLEIKKDELSRKIRHIEELCNMTDPLTVLQDPGTGDLCDPEEEGDDEDTGGHVGGDDVTGGHDGGDGDTGGHDRGDEDTGEYDGGDEDTRRHEGGDGDTRGHDGGDEDTKGRDGGDEDTRGHDKGDEDTRGHDGGDEDTKGYDGGDEDTRGHDKGDEDTGGHNGGDKVTRGHDGGDEDTGGGDYDSELFSLIRNLSGMIKSVTFFGYRAADILLDVNTANNHLLISDDLKTARWAKIRQNRPETAERFQDEPQVMSGSRFSSGRHYWDLEISWSSWDWIVAMCYPSIDRRGSKSYLRFNSKSWCLSGGRECNVVATHDGEMVRICSELSCGIIRICLDYEAGQLSFYDLCDPIRHLYTFTATFTEPLQPCLHIWKGGEFRL